MVLCDVSCSVWSFWENGRQEGKTKTERLIVPTFYAHLHLTFWQRRLLSSGLCVRLLTLPTCAPHLANVFSLRCTARHLWLSCFCFVCLSVSRPGCQWATSVCLLSRPFTGSRWLREAWSVSLSWPDFKIDCLARTPCSHSIAENRAFLVTALVPIMSGPRSDQASDMTHWLWDMWVRTIIEAHRRCHNASDCQLREHIHTHTLGHAALSFDSLIKVLLLVLRWLITPLQDCLFYQDAGSESAQKQPSSFAPHQADNAAEWQMMILFILIYTK